MAKFNENDKQEIKTTRDKCFKALKRYSDNKKSWKEIIPQKDRTKNVKNIEKSIYNETLKRVQKRENEEDLVFWFKREYRQLYQKVVSNLFINQCSKNILKRIKDEEMKVTDVAKMTHDELYPEKVEQAKQKYDRITFVGNNELILQQKLIKEAKEEGKEYQGQFKCRKCKSDKHTKFTTAQTRCADEPATVFVRCLICDIRWKR